MADNPPAKLVIDYGLLHDAANELDAIGPEVDRIKTITGARGGTFLSLPTKDGAGVNGGTVGPGKFGYTLEQFYAHWSGPLHDAGHEIEKLKAFFKGAAEAFMEADASQAAAINWSAAFSELLAYPYNMDQWNKMGPKSKAASPKPTPAPNPFSISPGVSTTFSAGAQDPNPKDHTDTPMMLPTTETTTVTSGGQTYTETTTFGTDKGWGPNGPTMDTKQVITHPDGSTDTITTTVNLDGSATAVDVASSTGITTTSTRSGWTDAFVQQSQTNPDGSDVGAYNPEDNPAPNY